MTSKPKPTCKFIICSHACAYHCTQLWYTIQHKWVLIIFSHNLQTIIIALMLSIGGKGKFSYTPLFHHHKALTLSLPSLGIHYPTVIFSILNFHHWCTFPNLFNTPGLLPEESSTYPSSRPWITRRFRKKERLRKSEPWRSTSSAPVISWTDSNTENCS